MEDGLILTGGMDNDIKLVDIESLSDFCATNLLGLKLLSQTQKLSQKHYIHLSLQNATPRLCAESSHLKSIYNRRDFGLTASPPSALDALKMQTRFPTVAPETKIRTRPKDTQYFFFSFACQFEGMFSNNARD